MQKLENYTLQKFMDSFVTELKRENEDRERHGIHKLIIPFVISTLYQSFNSNPEKYKELIEDLEKWYDYSLVIDKTVNDYDGIVDVTVSLVKYDDDADYDIPDYDYKLCFSYDERNWGYCECTPDMEDYREDKHCCGHGCDASFCSFTLHKIMNLGGDSWNGDEHDYWNFEDEFYASEKELADKKAEEDKARMIKELKSRIEADTKKLAELKGGK